MNKLSSPLISTICSYGDEHALIALKATSKNVRKAVLSPTAIGAEVTKLFSILSNPPREIWRSEELQINDRVHTLDHHSLDNFEICALTNDCLTFRWQSNIFGVATNDGKKVFSCLEGEKPVLFLSSYEELSFYKKLRELIIVNNTTGQIISRKELEPPLQPNITSHYPTSHWYFRVYPLSNQKVIIVNRNIVALYDLKNMCITKHIQVDSGIYNSELKFKDLLLFISANKTTAIRKDENLTEVPWEYTFNLPKTIYNTKEDRVFGWSYDDNNKTKIHYYTFDDRGKLLKTWNKELQGGDWGYDYSGSNGRFLFIHTSYDDGKIITSEFNAIDIEKEICVMKKVFTPFQKKIGDATHSVHDNIKVRDNIFSYFDSVNNFSYSLYFDPYGRQIKLPKVAGQIKRIQDSFFQWLWVPTAKDKGYYKLSKLEVQQAALPTPSVPVIKPVITPVIQLPQKQHRWKVFSKKLQNLALNIALLFKKLFCCKRTK